MARIIRASLLRRHKKCIFDQSILHCVWFGLSSDDGHRYYIANFQSFFFNNTCMCHLLPCFKGPTFFLRIIKYQLRITNCESESDEDICPTDYQVPVEDYKLWKWIRWLVLQRRTLGACTSRKNSCTNKNIGIIRLWNFWGIVMIFWEQDNKQ